MTKKERKQKIEDALFNLDQQKLQDTWNDFAETEDCLYDMAEFDEILQGWSPSEVALAIKYGDFNINHNFFSFSAYGNLVSYRQLCDGIDFESLADYVIGKDDDLGSEEIREILEEE